MTHAAPDHHWDPQPGDERRIRRHLDRQLDIAPGFVRLDDNRIVPVGQDAEGEADECD